MTYPLKTPQAREQISGWMPIETAPKDGTWFLAYRGPAKFGTWDRLVIVRWHDEFNDFIWPNGPFDIFQDDIDERDDHDRYVCSPYEACGSFTHWMPVPVAPASSSEDQP